MSEKRLNRRVTLVCAGALGAEAIAGLTGCSGASSTPSTPSASPTPKTYAVSQECTQVDPGRWSGIQSSDYKGNPSIAKAFGYYGIDLDRVGGHEGNVHCATTITPQTIFGSLNPSGFVYNKALFVSVDIEAQTQAGTTPEISPLCLIDGVVSLEPQNAVICADLPPLPGPSQSPVAAEGAATR